MAIENITVTETAPATVTITDETAAKVAVTTLEPQVTLNISTAGEVNTGRNLGTGAGTFVTKTGPILDFRSLKAGSSILVTAGSSEIDIALGEIEQHLTPAVNVTYDLGTDTRRFRDLYLSGSSIDLGGAPITSNGTSVAIPAGSTVGGNRILTVADSTSDLGEGTNLYYTDTRARGAVGATGDLSYDSSTGVFAYSTPTIPSDVGDLTDTGGLLTSDDLSNNTTSDLDEGTNLYYTTARFDTAFTGKDTDDLSEGTANQYYTDARSRSAISASGDISYNSSTGVISFTSTAGIQLTDIGVTLASPGSADLSYNNTSGVFTYTPPDLSGYLTSYSETDPVFTASPAGSITSTQTSEWDSAYSWGDHSTQGYLTGFTETDPVYTASSWSSTTNNSTQWDTAYGWGDHSVEGYLTSYTETDPIFTASQAFDITATNKSNWNTAYGWGDHSVAGYITGYTVTESDVTAHQSALSITESQISDLVHFSGSYTDLTDKPTIPAEYTDADARTAISLTTDSASLTYNNTSGVFTYTDPTGSPGPASHLEISVRNTSGSTIPANSAVYISGVQGNNDLIELAVNTGSNPAMGVTTSSIANNSNGIMIIGGEIGSFATGSYSENDTLYLSDVAGELTNVRPSAETQFVQNIGRVVRSHASNGTIIIQGAGRANDVPNLDSGHVFIGNGSGFETRDLTFDDITGDVDGGTY